MKYNFIAIGLSVLLLQSCTDNLIPHTGCEAVITGNECRGTFAESSSAFTSGSQVLLNAAGSLQADNVILTYTDNLWETENTLTWNGYAESAQLTVLHPVYPNLAYTQEELYRDGTLEDILYVQEEFPTGATINLDFKHLFSLLTLRLNGELQDNFQRIEVTCPVIIASIDPKSAYITFDHQESHTDYITQVSSSGNYSFIIPPAEDMPVSIKIQAADKTYSTQLNPRAFSSGKEYTYNIKVDEKTPGITTAEEWIAFSKLINSKILTSYKGKTLEDFGKTVDGVTTYYLLNDIDFTGVDCTDLEQIGETTTDYYFSDIFNGQGHTLYHIPILTKYGGTGVFGCISETGIVKNLHVESSNVTITSKSGSSKEGTGILVGRNNGKIHNCSVKGCQITANPTAINQSANTGGIAGSSTGEIINCHVENTNISYSSSSSISASPAGGIAGSSQGLIANCYSANNIVKNRNTYNGGICGKASSAQIRNCYVYNINMLATKGMLAGIAENSVFSHNYYHTTTSSIGKNSGGNQIIGNQLYTDNFTAEENIPVYQLLNEWIEQTAPTLYPDHIFIRWTDGGELPAIFTDL